MEKLTFILRFQEQSSWSVSNIQAGFPGVLTLCLRQFAGPAECGEDKRGQSQACGSESCSTEDTVHEVIDLQLGPGLRQIQGQLYSILLRSQHSWGLLF